MIRARANRVGASLNSGEGSSRRLQVPRPARIPFIDGALGGTCDRARRLLGATPNVSAGRLRIPCRSSHAPPLPRAEAETMPVAQGRCQLLRLVPLAGPWPAGTILIRLEAAT